MNKKMFSLFHVEFLIDIQASILTTLGQSSLVNRSEATRLDSTTDSNQSFVQLEIGFRFKKKNYISETTD
jgi:hypothetical protein